MDEMMFNDFSAVVLMVFGFIASMEIWKSAGSPEPGWFWLLFSLVSAVMFPAIHLFLLNLIPSRFKTTIQVDKLNIIDMWFTGMLHSMAFLLSVVVVWVWFTWLNEMVTNILLQVLFGITVLPVLVGVFIAIDTKSYFSFTKGKFSRR